MLAYAGTGKKPWGPSLHELQSAREAFEIHEPRDLFYRAATELVTLALEGKVSLSLAEALAVLLQTWNKMFYQYKKFDGQHFSEIEQLIADNYAALLTFRKRSIETFSPDDRPDVSRVFRAFEEVLGPVGAAKSLHLLAPRFFPLWDRAIAQGYGLTLKEKGRNADRYCRFMGIVKAQVESLGGEQALGRNPLKAIDEYNYCKFTKRWI